jgi:catechol 2,3-dioxygenase-like lactoylglutathione lyase family enzyme
MTLKVHGLAWLGSSSDQLDEMSRMLGELLELPVEAEQAGARVFRLPDGSGFEVFKPTDADHDFFEHPVAGLLVDDVAEVRAHLEAGGITFVGEVHQGVADSWATAWSHFRAPDGYLYVLVQRPSMEPLGDGRPFDELRICLRVDDLDEAVRVYRDGLGLPVVDDWTHPDGQRGVLFGACYAAIELFDAPQWDLVDDAETGRRLGRDHALRVEVRDLDQLQALAGVLTRQGARTAGEVTPTPWEQTCLRLTTHDEEQLTLFVLPEDERRHRAATRNRLRPEPQHRKDLG